MTAQHPEIRETTTGHIEQHGTDHVPISERHGSPRDLFMVWAGSNVSYLYFVLGGILVILGLDVWQALAVIIAGNLFYAGVGFLAASGPRAGVPSEVITRSFYGVRGNRVQNVFLGWLVGVLYEAINLSVGALVGFTLVQFFAPHAPEWVKAVLIVGLAILTFTISVYGHGMIMKISGWVTWVLLAGIAVLGFFVIQHTDFSYVPKDGPLSGPELWAAAAAGFTIIASAPLSWQIGADYSRYLPEDAPPSRVALWTGLGGFIPSVVIGALGVFAGTVADMAVPEKSMETLVPGWFYPFFLLVVIIGSITNNALTAYSTGLALMAAGIRWKRSVTVIFDAVIAVSITLYALFVSDFLGTLDALLEVSVAVLAPGLGIYVADIVLRKNRYRGQELQDESRGGPNWFWKGWNLAGCTALLVGTAVTALCINTTDYVGPIASALGGADVSPFVGVLLGGGLYWILGARAIRRSLLEPSAARRARGGRGMNDALQTVDRWFTAEPVADGITRIEEPHVHEFLRGNIWHIRGSVRDLVVDAGLGVGSLRDERPELFVNGPILVITHAHLDHMGSAHEFTERWAHAAEPLGAPHGTSIRGAELAVQLGLDGELPELLIDARPAGFDPDRYALQPAPASRTVADGDVIDLGNRQLRVLHLPGHTPGSICLFDETAGALFSGDVVYDDELLDELRESDRNDYAASMRRLRQLTVRRVYPGHGEPFDGARLAAIIDAYLNRHAAWTAQAELRDRGAAPL